MDQVTMLRLYPLVLNSSSENQSQIRVFQKTLFFQKASYVLYFRIISSSFLGSIVSRSLCIV